MGKSADLNKTPRSVCHQYLQVSMFELTVYICPEELCSHVQNGLAHDKTYNKTCVNNKDRSSTQYGKSSHLSLLG